MIVMSIRSLKCPSEGQFQIRWSYCVQNTRHFFQLFREILKRNMYIKYLYIVHILCIVLYAVITVMLMTQNIISGIRENVHKFGRIKCSKKILISQLLIFYSHRHFDHHWWSSSGTVSSLLARWRGEQTVPDDDCQWWSNC